MPDDRDEQQWRSQDGDRQRPPRSETDLEDELNKIMAKMTAPRTRTLAGATAASLSLSLSEMTHELPPELRRYSREELVDRILAAEHAMTENGEFVMQLDDIWYYANPDRPERFLLPHIGRIFPFANLGVLKARVMSERRQASARGFNVSRLDRALDMDDEEAEKALTSFLDDWGHAEEVLRYLNELDTRGFERDAEQLGSRIRSLEGLGDVKTEIYFLEKKIEQRKREVAPLLPKLERDIDAIQNDGYVVFELRRLLAKGDVQAIERAIQEFENDIDRLKELEKRAHKLRQQGFDVEIDLIKHHFSDPSKITLIEKEIESLEEEIRKEEEREGTFSEIEAMVKAWEEEGYDTTKLKTVFTKDMETIRTAVDNFKRAVERLKKMRKVLDSMEGRGIDNEVAKVRRLARNVENIDRLGQAINALMDIIEENRALEQAKQVHREKLEAWKAEGWKVDGLMPLFDGDIGELEAGIMEFEGTMQVMRTHIAVLDSMDLLGFEKEAGIIRRMAMNLKNMDKVKEAIETLAQAIEESKEAQKPRMPTIYPSERIRTMIETLPKGLPSTLWGRPSDELAEAIVKGPFGNTHDRKVVVRLARRWYFYEPDEPDIMLQPFEGEVELLDMEQMDRGT